MVNQMLDIESLIAFAKRNKSKAWYKGILKVSDHEARGSIKKIPGLLEHMQKFTGYYPGKSGPCLTRQELTLLRDPDIKRSCDWCGSGDVRFHNGSRSYSNACSCSCSGNLDVPKRKATCLELYGVENPSQVKEFQDRRDATFEKKYGGNPFANEEIKRKILSSMVSRHGVTNPSKSAEIQHKKVHTFLERFGETHWTKNRDRYSEAGNSFTKEMLKKAANTYEARTGFRNPLHNPEVLEKVRKTNVERLGVENPFASKTIHEKIRKTNLERYGVEAASASPEVKAKIEQTNLERYGVEHPVVLPEFRHQWKSFVDPNGIEHRVEGYEDKALKKLCALSSFSSVITERSSKRSLQYTDPRGKCRRYYPDIFLTTVKVILDSLEHIGDKRLSKHCMIF
jgi:hypothetical protein